MIFQEEDERRIPPGNAIMPEADFPSIIVAGSLCVLWALILAAEYCLEYLYPDKIISDRTKLIPNSSEEMENSP